MQEKPRPLQLHRVYQVSQVEHC